MKWIRLKFFSSFALVALFVTMAQGQSVSANIGTQGNEQRVALVIGNGAYGDAPLKNPPNDARAMAQALRECDFHTIEEIDGDKRRMVDAIREFGKQIRRGGVGLFFYAGHGMQVGGTNYLVPVGADVKKESDVEFECVDANRVLGEMEDAGNQINIIILDACRNNPFARSFRSSDRGLKKMDTPTGSLLAYATAPGDVAADGDGANGLYTSVLLKHMRQPGISIMDVFMRVRRDVKEASGDAQVPWESTSLTDDFNFVPSSSSFSRPQTSIPTSSPITIDNNKPHGSRSPGLAAALEIVPSLGHAYAGNWKKGLKWVMVQAVGLAIAGSTIEEDEFGETKVKNTPLAVAGYTVWGLGLVRSMFSAYSTAEDYNEGQLSMDYDCTIIAAKNGATLIFSYRF